MKFKFKNLILLGSFISLISVPIVSILVNNNHLINSYNELDNSTQKINSDNYFSQTLLSNEFNFNQTLLNQSNSVFLFSKENNNQLDPNSILEFDESRENTLVLDLNIWKPVGMDDEVFLRSINFDIDIDYNDNNLLQINSQSENLNNVIKYNITDNDFKNVPELKQDWDNLNPYNKSLSRKLIFNFINNNSSNNYFFQSSKGYCYLVYDIEHVKNEQKNINKILITPKIIYSYTNDINYLSINFSILKNTKINLIFKSDLLISNVNKNTIVDSYVSDTQHFNIYEKRYQSDSDFGSSSSPSNDNKDQPITYPNALINTYANKNEVILSSKSDYSGFKIPPLEIDTSNLYFDDDINHKNTPFEVQISGIKISDGSLKISSEKQPINFYDSNNKNELYLKFQIVDSYFDTNNEKIVTFNLFNQNQLINFSHSINPAGVKLEIKIVPTFDENNVRIPFKYEINEFRFIASSYNDFNNQISVNAKLLIDSSSNVILKTKPINFSYTKICNELLNVQKQLFTFSSNYSSNVFDDSYLLNDQNQIIETNLSICKNELDKLFNLLITKKEENQVNHFINAGINWTTINSPFIKHQYTSNNNEHRTKGNLIYKFGLVKENKYTDNLEVTLRAKVDNEQNQHEIINVSFNDELLSKKAESFKSSSELVNFLNQLDNSSKKEYLNIINLDTDDPSNFLINNLYFKEVSGQNKIMCYFDLSQNYYVINNNHLVNKNAFIESKNLKLSTFNENQVSLSINETNIRNKAKLATDYNDFKQQNQNNILDFIQISNPAVVANATFVDTPGFEHKVSIEVTLVSNCLFDNNTNKMVVSCGNVNWKNENNVPIPIKIDINKQIFASSVKQYESVLDFIEHNSNPLLNDWVNCIEFELTSYDNKEYLSSINDLYSIKFEPLNSSSRKIKIIIQAKEWRYFEFNGSTFKDDSISFVIGNLLFKNEDENQLTGLNFNIDYIYLDQLLTDFYSTHEKKSFKPFIDEYYNSFVVYKKNEVSIIKISPYDFLGFNAPSITYNNNGIDITIELNDGYYLNDENSDFNNNQFNTTYHQFISIDDIKQYHEQINDPTNDLIVNDIQVNTAKLANDCNQFNNINQFLQSIKNDYDISEYLIFSDYNDIAKVNDYQIIKNDPTSLTIKITINVNYCFNDEPANIKTKEFKINNLLFKNQTQTLIPISFVIDSNKLALIAKNYNNVNDLVKSYENKNQYNDFSDFISISNNQVDSINSIKMINGTNNHSIQLVIELKNGYYFKNQSPLIATAKIQISNLLFKNDPPPTDALIGVDVSLLGNKLLDFAKTFDNFDLFKKQFLENYNYQNYIDIKLNKDVNENPIKFIDINLINNNQAILKITLNDGYYFNNQDYYNLDQNFIIGNLYFKNDPNIDLKNIDIKFNTKSFYKLMSSQKINNWFDFISIISPHLMNFHDQNNAMLYTNTNDSSVYNVIEINPSNDDGIIITVGLKNGYYFSDDDKSNTQINLTYSRQQLIDYFNKGKDQINHEIFIRNLIIILSTTIPFVIVAIFIVVWVLKTKSKNKKEEQ